MCDGSGACVECLAGTSCASGVCSASHTCSAPTCLDTVKNGSETDVDCGGASCSACHSGGVRRRHRLPERQLRRKRLRGESPGDLRGEDARSEQRERRVGHVQPDRGRSVVRQHLDDLEPRKRSDELRSPLHRHRHLDPVAWPSAHRRQLVCGNCREGWFALERHHRRGQRRPLQEGSLVIDADLLGFDAASKAIVAGAGFVCEGSPATSFSTAGDRSIERNPNYKDTDANDVDFTTSSPSTPLASTSPTSP